jgi:phage gp37-like protein
MPKAYANYLQHQDQHNLNMVCMQFATVGYGVFLVGSVLDRPDFRDVDVRCILADEEFAALPIPFTLNACISEWMRQRTGLPIDFQFQSQTDANTNHDHKRSALGHAPR